MLSIEDKSRIALKALVTLREWLREPWGDDQTCIITQADSALELALAPKGAARSRFEVTELRDGIDKLRQGYRKELVEVKKDGDDAGACGGGGMTLYRLPELVWIRHGKDYYKAETGLEHGDFHLWLEDDDEWYWTTDVEENAEECDSFEAGKHDVQVYYNSEMKTQLVDCLGLVEVKG